LHFKFPVVATGGTFDEIHTGHVMLLAKAFEVGNKVIIGISSDEFATKRGKKINHNFEQRAETLRKVITKEFGDKNTNYEIAKLEEDFGPMVTTDPNVAALVASSETAEKGKILNERRTEKGLEPVQIIAVDMVKAEDGLPISSTRIRAGEIDSSGKILARKKKRKN
jgi:pantetheine-phosphate adenylyltransferase